jgi:hypothetical protein
VTEPVTKVVLVGVPVAAVQPVRLVTGVAPKNPIVLVAVSLTMRFFSTTRAAISR